MHATFYNFNSTKSSSYQGGDTTVSYDSIPICLPNTININDEVEDIVNYQEVATRTGTYHKIQGKWKEHPQIDCTPTPPPKHSRRIGGG